MVRHHRSRWALVLVALIAACTRDANRVTGPAPTLGDLDPARAIVTLLPSVRISEIHYDNAGTDTGEAIEISGPAGQDLTGYSIVLYNGNGGAPYSTRALTGTIPATCGARGVVVTTYPTDGIQNGTPDGVALVGPATPGAPNGTLIEFLTYEGPFTAVGGVANGVTGTDIVVVEGTNTLIGQSLQRTALGPWIGPTASTFGSCNDDDSGTPQPVIASVTISPAAPSIVAGTSQQFTARAFDASNTEISGVTFTWTSATPTVATIISSSGLATGVSAGTSLITALSPNGVSASATLTVTAPQGPALPDIRVTEIHYDNVGVDVNERIEIEGPAGTDLTGWQLVLYNGTGGASYNTTSLAGAIPATCGARGVVVVSYPQDNLQNGPSDGVALVDAGGTIIEFLSYEGVLTATNGPAAGTTSVDIGVVETSVAYGRSLQRSAGGVWAAGAANFGACNGGGGTALTNASITVTGRDAIADPALPIGFQDQIFGAVRDGNGVDVTSAVTWTTLTPGIASVEANTGVVTALAAGSALLRATAANGAVADFTLPTRAPVASTTAQYGHNTEFGEPADGDASDDFILRRTEYTSSYSRIRNTPNWVAYDIDPTHFGAEDRCDCFTFDPLLPGDFTRYTTADYTGAGAAAGYGIDRGHLARSFDRTSASLDNARSFYFSNIIPQANAVNTGPWAVLENFLGDQARLNGKEVFVIAGVAGSKGTVKNEGIITIPSSVWKVAVILPRDQGLANVVTGSEPEIVAVIMPNDPTVNADWTTYRTTVDAVEALSGYDLLALLPDDIETQLEKGNAYPSLTVTPPAAWTSGVPANLSISFTDTNVREAPFTVRINWGDGSPLTQFVSTILPTAPFLRPHTYAAAGSYTITASVTDRGGATTTKTVAIQVQP